MKNNKEKDIEGLAPVEEGVLPVVEDGLFSKKRKITKSEQNKRAFQKREKKRRRVEEKADYEQRKAKEDKDSFKSKTAEVSGSSSKYEIMNQQLIEIQKLRLIQKQEEEDDGEVFAENESFIERNAKFIREDQLIDTEDKQLDILDQVLDKFENQQSAKIADDAKQKKTEKKKLITTKIALHCDYVGAGEFGNTDQLAQVCLVNENGECVYLQHIEPRKRITDYRTKETGLSESSFTSNTKPLSAVRKELNEKLTDPKNPHVKKVLVGHNLAKHVPMLFGKYNIQFQRDISLYSPIYRCALPRKKGVMDVIQNKDVPDELPVEPLQVLTQKFLGIGQELLIDALIKAQCVMRIYKNYEKDYDSFFTKNQNVQIEAAAMGSSENDKRFDVKAKEKAQAKKKQQVTALEEVQHRVQVRKSNDDMIDSLMAQLKSSGK